MADWPLHTIISGGQTGADLAGLMAARFLHYATGGVAPKGYRTETGPNLALRDCYGLAESRSADYVHRTRVNVRMAAGTVIFTSGPVDGGSALTKSTCVALGKPVLVNPFEGDLRQWIVQYYIAILNVAGNRESKSPGIASWVYQYLIRELNKPEPDHA